MGPGVQSRSRNTCWKVGKKGTHHGHIGSLSEARAAFPVVSRSREEVKLLCGGKLLLQASDTFALP